MRDAVLHDRRGRRPAAVAGHHPVGAWPHRDALAGIEATGLPHAPVGDANDPGDTLAVLRDATMMGLAPGPSPATAATRETAA